MSQQAEANIPPQQLVKISFQAIAQRSGIPFPIAPLTKAAILISIILIDLLSIAVVVLSLPIYARHDGYGRQGAWTRPWNDGGGQVGAFLWSVISVITFGCHGLSELHPRHVFYTRTGLFIGMAVVIWSKWMSVVDIGRYAWHFLSFGKKDDLDAYRVGILTVCTLFITVVSLVLIVTYLNLCLSSMSREENEATVVDEMSETDPLLRSIVVTASSNVAERSPPNLVAITGNTN